MILRWVVLVVGLWLAPCGVLLAQTRALTPVAAPPEPPILRIDAEFHTQVVNRFAMDPDGRIIVTASDDKTLRVWRATDGTALATLRVPIADGDEGALYAVAVSPDGKTLLAGGFTGYAWDRSFALYIFDLETQRLRGRLPNLPAPVNHIAYAPDGRSFAIALAGPNGIRMMNAQTGAQIWADPEYRERATWVDFDASGRLAAVGFDGEVRLYDAAGKRIAHRAPVAGGHPYSVAFSPDGRTVAVGYADQPRVEVLNGQTLAGKASLASAGGGTGLGAVAWGADGGLFAAGSLRGGDGGTLIRHWPAGGGKPTDMAGLRDTVFQIAALPDGGVVLAGADPALARLDRAGRDVFRKTGPGLDFRDVAERRFLVSADGLSVQVQTRTMMAPWLVDMAERKVASVAATRALTPVPAPSVPPAPVGPPVRVTNWRNEAEPRVDGQKIGLDAEELSRSFAVTPAQDFVVLGTDYRLRVVRRDGHPAGSVALPGPAWAVGVSGDGRMVVAAVGDGTLRWFGLDTAGQLTPRVSAFLAADGKRWVAWTDGGFFDHSDQGGEQLVGLLLNRSRAQAPDWFSFAQVYRLFYAPDTVAARLLGQDAPDPSAGVAGLRSALAKAPPPRIDLISVCWTLENASECRPIRPSTSRDATAQGAGVTLPPQVAAVEVRYRLAGAAAEKDSVDLFVNGRNAGRTEGEVSRGGDAAEITQRAPVDPGPNQIQLRAYDHDGSTYAQSQPIRLTRSTPAAGSLRKPKLFILSVGVNRYPPTINSLNFAVADAHSVATAIKEHVPAVYGAVDETELYDEAASSPAVLAALRAIAEKAEASDTVIIYLSGHGVQLDKRYYFVTQNVGSLEAVPTAALSEEGLIKALASIRAKNGLLFLDTCHAGAFSLDSAGQIAHESGRYVLAASASVEEALDSYDNHNGVFATAVLRGLAGQGGEDATGVVNNFQLGLFVTPLVRQLASEKHHNQSAKFKIEAEDAEPFPIVQVGR